MPAWQAIKGSGIGTGGGSELAMSSVLDFG